MATSRCVSPIICGTLFAWSLRGEKPFPLNFWFVFVLCAVLFVGLFAYTFLLSPSLDNAHPEVEMLEEEEEE